MREVGSVAGTDLDDLVLEAGQQPAAMSVGASPLHDSGEALVEAGEDGVVDAHRASRVDAIEQGERPARQILRWGQVTSRVRTMPAAAWPGTVQIAS